MAYYWLTPPSRAVFFISVLLAVLALLVRYAHVAIPVVSNHSFETLLIGFLHTAGIGVPFLWRGSPPVGSRTSMP